MSSDRKNEILYSMDANNIVVRYANASHAVYAERICQLIYESALQRGTGIAKRSPE